MHDSSVIWKYVRAVDSVRAAVAYQGQDEGLEPQGQGHNFVLKDNQGSRTNDEIIEPERFVVRC